MNLGAVGAVLAGECHGNSVAVDIGEGQVCAVVVEEDAHSLALGEKRDRNEVRRSESRDQQGRGPDHDGSRGGTSGPWWGELGEEVTGGSHGERPAGGVDVKRLVVGFTGGASISRLWAFTTR